MKGRLTIIPVQGAVSSQELTAPCTLKALKDGIGGGYIEVVPGFTRWQGRPCVAFCDEDGKRKRLPVNQNATAYWHIGLGRHPHDYLVGPIVIITGDRELMEEL